MLGGYAAYYLMTLVGLPFFPRHPGGDGCYLCHRGHCGEAAPDPDS